MALESEQGTALNYLAEGTALHSGQEMAPEWEQGTALG